VGGLEKLKAKSNGVFPVYADISEESDVLQSLKACRDKLGRIDSVLHIAGILDRHQTDDLTIDIWDQVMAVNLRGTFILVHAIAPIMREQNGCRIVLTASDSARMGSLMSGPAHAASKGGVIALTHFICSYVGQVRHHLQRRFARPRYDRYVGRLGK
jgi:3-oxoacyl-[acyl-carrier protein] reductase